MRYYLVLCLSIIFYAALCSNNEARINEASINETSINKTRHSINAARFIKLITSDADYHLDISNNSLTLYKTLDSGLYIAAQINIYEQSIGCAAFNSHRCYHFTKDAALMVTKTIPQLNELGMIMRHHPREHYFFLLPSITSINNSFDPEDEAMELDANEDEEELVTKLYSIKI